MNWKNEEKKKRSRVMKFLKNNPWIVKMWKEQEKVRSDYYKKQDAVEKKFGKVAKRKGIKEIWFAIVEGETFGIDVNNVREFGDGKNRFLIHDSDIRNFEETKVKK